MVMMMMMMMMMMFLQTAIYDVVSEKQKLDTDGTDSSGGKIELPSSVENVENKRWSCC